MRQLLWSALLLLVTALVSVASARSPSVPTPGRVAQSTSTAAPAAVRGEATPISGSEAYAPGAYRLQPGELVLAADDDDIPAIFADDTLFVDAETGSSEWRNDDLVIGLNLEEEARAYPVRLLSSHEIVNDVVGGRPVVITWCPLCYSALVFDRVVERELTFGVSGYLFHNNLVMYDHQTNTLWSQILAQGIRGALNGERLSLVPSQLMEWGQWKTQHPDTWVLSAERLGKQANTIVDPYAGYYASGVAGLTGSPDDDRLGAKELVVGLVVGQQSRAYPLSAVKEHSPINDRLAAVPLLLIYDEGRDVVRVYHRAAEGRTLTFQESKEQGFLRDENTGSLWNASDGRAVEGALQGSRLQRLSAPLVYWFAWSGIYPETELSIER